MDKHTDRWMDIRRDGQMEIGQTGSQMDSQTVKWSYRQMDDRHTERQTDK
jgi:hypothetical protein